MSWRWESGVKVHYFCWVTILLEGKTWRHVWLTQNILLKIPLCFLQKRFKISVIINRKKPTVLKYPDDAIIFLFFSISSVKSARKQDGKIVVFSVRNRNRCTESLSYFRFRTLNFSVPVLILHHDYQLLYSWNVFLFSSVSVSCWQFARRWVRHGRLTVFV